MFKEIP